MPMEINHDMVKDRLHFISICLPKDNFDRVPSNKLFKCLHLFYLEARMIIIDECFYGDAMDAVSVARADSEMGKALSKDRLRHQRVIIGVKYFC